MASNFQQTFTKLSLLGHSQANLLDWNATSANSGTGSLGACCTEMDIWEANDNAAAYTPHVCRGTTQGQVACTGTDCGDGDQRYPPYRLPIFPLVN